MSVGRVLTAIALCLALALPTAAGAEAAPLPAASAQQAPAAAPKEAAKRFTPRSGVTFNSPLRGSGTAEAILGKIIRTIQATPKGESIRVMSWNIMSWSGVNALINAQRRGVRVKALMASKNLTDVPNPWFRKLRRALHNGNKGRRKSRHSYARICIKSCRGQYGEAHAKYYLFSKAGRARHVVIQGSANLTTASAHNQWNDIFTTVGKKNQFKFMVGRFEEAAKDKPVKGGPYAQFASKEKNRKLILFPGQGADSDPVMKLVRSIQCRGARNTANGRTVVRVSPDVIRQPRGLRLAQELRKLWLNGCNLTIGYTVMGYDVHRLLKLPSARGPVPMRHLVQDFDGDGQFDNYFHLKTIAVQGRVAGNPRSWVTMNGSSNWSGSAWNSDENIGYYASRRITRRYIDHLNYWYTHFPQSAQLRVSARMLERIDPYEHVDMD